MTNAWIQTFSGMKFTPLTPKMELIRPKDFIHALSNMCRFTGHVRDFYSVAEHSRRVADYFLGRKHSAWNKWWNVGWAFIAKWTDGWIVRDLTKGCTCHQIHMAQYGLVHDGSEGYLTDIARPLKIQPEYEQYRKNEATLQKLIYNFHNLDEKEPPELKDADYMLCNLEKRELFDIQYAFRPEDGTTIILPQGGQGMGWSPKVAEAMFWELYYCLFPGQSGF